MKPKSKKILSLLVLLILLFIPQLFLPKINPINNMDFNEKKSYNKKYNSNISESPLQSNITYINNKYNLSDWWNKTYRYRICIELEEIDSIDRYQPVEVYLMFLENEHFENTTRLVSYNATGKNEWSDPIPIQVWNITNYQNTNYIKTCTITFITNISANSNKIYFLYYNVNMVGIEIPNYKTDFSSILSDGKLDISLGSSESNFILYAKFEAVSSFFISSSNIGR